MRMIALRRPGPLTRLTMLFLVLAALVAVPFLIWGEAAEAMFSREAMVARLGDAYAAGWVAGIALLIADLVLPVPNTAVMAALGVIYGPLAGGAAAALGSFLSGLLGYGLCRVWGRPAARRLIGEAGIAEGEALFARAGGWLVALSRWLPVLPEVVSCMAGIVRMRLSTFAIALACGAVPLGFVMAFAGHRGADRPVLTLALCAGLPVLLWLLARRIGPLSARAAAGAAD